jgi:hypothetical protein
MQLLITKSDFVLPYPTLSKNTDEVAITPSIWKSQNEGLIGVLGEPLYTDLTTIYNTTKPILGVAVGLTTVLTLSDTTGLLAGYYCTFSDLVGTIAPLINGVQFEILAVLGNTITIGLDSAGLAYTSGGNLGKVLTPPYFALYAYISPYLIYASAAEYVPFSHLKDTNSGYLMHNVGEATQPTEKQLGTIANSYRESAKSYADRLLAFLNNNQSTYPLFVGVCISRNETQPIFFKFGNNINQGLQV